MKLVTHFELATKDDSELYALLREAFNSLTKSDPETPDRRNALASLENIQREIASRTPYP